MQQGPGSLVEYHTSLHPDTESLQSFLSTALLHTLVYMYHRYTPSTLFSTIKEPIIYHKWLGPLTIQMLILTYIRTILSTHRFILTITSSHSQHSYPATHNHQTHLHLLMLTPEFIPMRQLHTRNDPHVQDEPSDGVHHIRVPRPPRFSFNGNIHPLHQQSYAIGDKVYFEESIEPYIFLGMTTKRAVISDCNLGLM